MAKSTPPIFPWMRHWEANWLHIFRLYCLSVCALLQGKRGAAKGQRTPLTRQCSSLFPPQENTNNSIRLATYLLRHPCLVNRYSWNLVEGFTVSLSRDVGRLTVLMAVKISGRMLTLEKATGNGRGWKREFTSQSAPSQWGEQLPYFRSLP